MLDEELNRTRVARARRVVIKIGSALLTDPVTGLARERIRVWCGEISRLLGEQRQILLVSSGAVAEGVARLGLRTRPSTVHGLQAAAAVGQMGLVEAYEQAFSAHGRRTAMVLLTHDDLADRQRYLNARATLNTLLDLGVIPIINENDTVATEEIRFGDNDTLGALVTNLLQADLLIILTDRAGLHERDPRVDPAAPVVSCADAADPALDAMIGEGAGLLGRGGMSTKVRAARIAARSGAHTVIAGGERPQVLTSILAGERVGTLLCASVLPLDARKRWIAGQLKPKGELVLDDGAVRAVTSRGVSLLPVGVTAVRGTFARGDVVRCVDAGGAPIAQGLVNYSSEEAVRLAGVTSAEIHVRLGYALEPELVHRDNLVVLAPAP
ncbi:MAG: glutamate 5-kinase [Pseudomonadales bacterium]|nr:glutamate 5-kinase [Pseudomonadales bacterium]